MLLDMQGLFLKSPKMQSFEWMNCKEPQRVTCLAFFNSLTGNKAKPPNGRRKLFTRMTISLSLDGQRYTSFTAQTGLVWCGGGVVDKQCCTTVCFCGDIMDPKQTLGFSVN